jgi:hypothetical protein
MASDKQSERRKKREAMVEGESSGLSPERELLGLDSEAQGEKTEAVLQAYRLFEIGAYGQARSLLASLESPNSKEAEATSRLAAAMNLDTPTLITVGGLALFFGIIVSRVF